MTDSFAKYGTSEEGYAKEYRTLVEAYRFLGREIIRATTEQLRYAVGDDGLTPESIECYGSDILDLLGTRDGRVACEIIRGILEIMAAKNIRNIDEIRSAFGGEGYPKTLKERRQAIAPTSGVTVGGVRQRENVGLELMAIEIIKLAKARRIRMPVEPSVVDAINGFRTAVQEQTALLRQIHNL